MIWNRRLVPAQCPNWWDIPAFAAGRNARNAGRAELRHRSPGFRHGVSLSVTLPSVPTRFSVRRGRVHCVRRNACEVVLRRSWSGRRLASPPAAALHFAGPQFFHFPQIVRPRQASVKTSQEMPAGRVVSVVSLRRVWPSSGIASRGFLKRRAKSRGRGIAERSCRRIALDHESDALRDQRGAALCLFPGGPSLSSPHGVSCPQVVRPPSGER